MAAKTVVVATGAAVLGLLAGYVGRGLREGVAPAGPDVAARETPPEPEAAAPEPGPERLVLDLRGPAAEAGGGRVEGRVLSLQGEPVVGAEVVARPAEDHAYTVPVPQDRADLQQWVQDTVAHELRRRARERTVSRSPTPSCVSPGARRCSAAPGT